MTIIVVANVRAVDAAAAEEIQKHISAVRDYALSDAEPGTSMYIPTRGKEDPLAFTVLEEYADEAAMNAHLSTPVFGALAAQADKLFEGGKAGLKITLHTRF